MQNHAQNNTKNSQNHDYPLVTDFGVRAIVTQGFSKLVALPKTALTNCGLDKKVRIHLVYDNGEKYLKISPLKGKGGESNE